MKIITFPTFLIEDNMALSDKRIIEEMREGNIIITPFDERNLSTSSYDVTLGDIYYRPREANSWQNTLFNIYDEVNVRKVYGMPRAADLVGVNSPWFHNDMVGISPDDKVIMLAPGESILAHTNEFIGGRNHITTMMKARSSLGRSFIQVCKCAGWGDVGYVNRWTMEITNGSKDYHIPLIVGRRIAQIVFFETGPILGRDYSNAGKYQSSPSIEELKKNWKPEDMLPRLYKDRDIKV